MNADRVAAEFLRALRGKRSQTAFCRRLGYRSNVAYLWEAGRGFPSAARALQVASTVGIDVQHGVRRFYGIAPPWLDEVEVASPEGVAHLLTDLKGKTSVVDLARYSGKSRFAIARWLKGQAEPRLHEFFQLVECASLRLVDLLESWIDPRLLPSVRERYESMRAARGVAYDAPWTQAVLRALELSEYQALKRPPQGWIARRLGIGVEDERRCLDLLLQAGQIRRDGAAFRPVEVMALDVRRDPAAAARLRGFWGRTAAERVEAGQRGMMYSICGVSRRDLQRLRDLQQAYFNEVRAIIAQSEPVERVILTTTQVVDLGDEEAPR